MERDELIITVYCWVCDQMQVLKQQMSQQQVVLRQGGFEPGLTDEEALCIELCGEMLRLRSDKSVYGYFALHWRHFFPRLPHRTSYVRQVANLWRVKECLFERLLARLDEWIEPLQPIDTMPLPICQQARARSSKCLRDVARFSVCGTKGERYYGFKLGLRITPCGLITRFALLQSNPHDTNFLEELTWGHQGSVPVDKGFFKPKVWRLLKERGIHIVGHGGKGVDHTRPAELILSEGAERFCARVRKRIETVGAHLCQRFGVDSIRVRDLWHYKHRLLRKILAHNILVALNLMRGHTPLDFDDLVGD